MELTNEFTVGVPTEQAWALLTDVERIAPCMPGAELQEVEGDEYRGVVKVKVGPITAQYKGRASFVERDVPGLRAVLKAEGRETRGQGNASATISASLHPDPAGTRVAIVTDLAVTGRVAQFGRGVLADVSSKLLGQFVDCLETTVLGRVESPAQSASAGAPAVEKAVAEPPPAATSTVEEGEGATGPITDGAPASPGTDGAGQPTIRRPETAPAEPVDLIDVAGGSVVRRVAPAAAVGLVAILLLLIRRRRRR
ncbi:MAG TPA: SRPBCC family protein [Acidimicrobiales bacterium]|nr:SRPBCC family protein [Acidimicrobiales bacterium]